jgi:hypothetical protein
VGTKADWVTGLSEKLVKRLRRRLLPVRALRDWLQFLLPHETGHFGLYN